MATPQEEIKSLDSSASASESSDNDDQEWSDWDEDESEAVKCLFSADTLPTVEAALKFDAEQNNFDLISFIKQNPRVITSEYDVFKVINYIRSEVASGRDPRPLLNSFASEGGSTPPWQGDNFLAPVLPNDELLLKDWEELDLFDTTADNQSGQQDSTGHALPPATADDAARLQAENTALRAALDALQSLALQESAVLQELSEEQQQLLSQNRQDKDSATAGTSTTILPDGLKDRASSSDLPEDSDRVDAAYFDSYSSFDIHRQMLGDRERTLAYLEALEHNPSLMKGATVLDVGCGTGVLSMFAVRGGAATVVAVDGSEKMAEVARQNCAANKMDGKIRIVAGRVESLKTLPGIEGDGKVDVLVSEWMGYALLFETMLDSVLYARDAFLKPGGAILPDIARVHLAAGTSRATGLGFWDNVYGLSMAPISERLRGSALEEAVVKLVEPEDIVTESQLLQSFDLAHMAAEDQDFTANFDLKVKSLDNAHPNGSSVRECQALVIWFDTLFSERFCKDRPVELSTSFDLPPTHWVQTVLVLPEPVLLGLESSTTTVASGGEESMNKKVAVSLSGRLSMARRPGQHRCLDISVEYAPVYVDGSIGETKVQIYAMGVLGGQ